MPDFTPFDALASTYDADFTGSPVARELRGRVHDRLAGLFPPGTSALELGCGTGEDALWLGRRGVRVTATDSSARMLEYARARTAGAPNVTVERLDLTNLPDAFHGPYDAVFANFGVLNVLPGWHELARWLAGRVVTGGGAGFAVMSRACLWEVGWHGLHGDWRTARRRWRGTAPFAVGGGPAVTITYPSARAFADAFASWFRPSHVEALGVFLPPSDVYGVLERRPRLLRGLTALDRRIGRGGWLANLADHFWIEFRRTDQPP